MNSLLYSAIVLIWGTTWIAIKMQQGNVAAEISIFWRFVCASAVLMIVLITSKRLKKLNPRGHALCLLQGVSVFGVNFYCFYHAVSYIPSGLESVIFSMAMIFNALNSWIFFRQPIPKNFLIAASLGLSGIVFLFWQDLMQFNQATSAFTGVFLSLLGTYSFSIGNMISVKHQRDGNDVMSTNAWGMLYGAIAMGCFAYWQGFHFVPELRFSYLSSLLYLSLFGSVIGFGAYFILVGRIGASQAAYATLLFPLVALAVSTYWEGYVWHWHAIIGLCLILCGNGVMFCKPERLISSMRSRLI